MHGTIEVVKNIHTVCRRWEFRNVNQLGLKLELDGWVGYFTNHFLPKRLFLEPVARWRIVATKKKNKQSIHCFKVTASYPFMKTVVPIIESINRKVFKKWTGNTSLLPCNKCIIP